jgi:hypothetical protein
MARAVNFKPAVVKPAGVPKVAAPSYLPASAGALPATARSPIATRALHSQVLGSVVGRRGAGITNLGPGNPAAHSVSHYGKDGLPGLDGSGGDFGSF